MSGSTASKLNILPSCTPWHFCPIFGEKRCQSRSYWMWL